jgi:Flp pilus assembly protein TadG
MKPKSYLRSPFKADCSGQTMVEFSAVATVLFLLMFALMSLGTAVYSYNTVSSATREAVRYAIVHSPTSQDPATDSQIQQVAIDYAVGLGLKDGDVVVSWPTDPINTKKTDAQVQISYPYQVKIPFLKPVSVNLTSTSRMMVSQ